MRKLIDAGIGRGNFHLAQRLDRATACCTGGNATERHLAFDDLPADRQHGIERRRRILEDETDIAGAQHTQCLGISRDDVRACKTDRASDAGIVRQQPCDRQTGDTLA